MSLMIQLADEMKQAMRDRDAQKLSALRMLISAVRYGQIDVSTEFTDAQVIEILKKEAKKRRESVVAYTVAGRTEQAEAENFELKLIESYLPKQMSEEEVRRKLTAYGVQLVGKNFGEIMQIVMKEFRGLEVDGGMVSRLVKELYGNN